MGTATLLLLSSELRRLLVLHSARPPLIVGLICMFCLVATFGCASATGSMALTAYAYLCVFDLAMVATLLVTLWVRDRQPTGQFSYGYERFEVVAVFTGTVLAQLGALFIVKESVERLLEPAEVHGSKYLVGISLAFASHMLVIYTLRNDAFNHVVVASSSSWLQEHVADVSRGLCRFIPPLSTVLLPRVNPFSLLAVSGAVTCLTSYLLVVVEECHNCDTVAAVLLAIMIIGSMNPMSVYTGKILLQTTPSHVVGQLDKCLREATTVDGVLEFTHEHFWQLSFGQLAGSVHVRVRRDADEQLVLAHVTERLSAVVAKLTVQVVKDTDWATLSGAVTHHGSHDDVHFGHSHGDVTPCTGHGHSHDSSHDSAHGHSHDHAATAPGGQGSKGHDDGGHGHSHDAHGPPSTSEVSQMRVGHSSENSHNRGGGHSGHSHGPGQGDCSNGHSHAGQGQGQRSRSSGVQEMVLVDPEWTHGHDHGSYEWAPPPPPFVVNNGVAGMGYVGVGMQR